MNLKLDQTKCKVFLDESYEHEQEPGKTKEIWRYYEIRGKYGYMYSYSEHELALVITSNKVAMKNKHITANWPVIQNGTSEIVFKLDSKGLEPGIQIIKTYKRRPFGIKSVQHLAKYHFRPFK